MDLKGSVALVTGGASGLGAATVAHLAERGCDVLAVDLQEAFFDHLEDAVKARVRFIQADVTDESQVQAAIDLAQTEFGALHLAVNCAGIVAGSRVVGKQEGAFLPHALSLFQRVIEVNLIGTFNVLRLSALAMQRNTPDRNGERGVIINTASVAAYDGQIGQVAYAASKGAIVSMTLPAARDLAASGVRVMAIAPGLFETPLLGSLPEEIRQSLGRQVPFPPRLGRPEEYASLVESIFINPMLNGEVIRLDGAIRMAPK
jgi:NAD(P)-dependent dehydrogenase (short-subunit alcohol dehydrogenase family)